MFVVTGAPGSGKTPLVGELARLGYAVAEEPARAVLAEQRGTGGSGTYDRDPQLFFQLMLDRAVAELRRMSGSPRPVFFDRGIPDLIGYAELFGFDPSEAARAARHRYADVVFVLPSWPEIYTTDEDRRMSFGSAERFGERVREIYIELGYDVVELPRDTPAARATSVVGRLGLG